MFIRCICNAKREEKDDKWMRKTKNCLCWLLYAIGTATKKWILEIYQLTVWSNSNSGTGFAASESLRYVWSKSASSQSGGARVSAIRGGADISPRWLRIGNWGRRKIDSASFNDAPRSVWTSALGRQEPFKLSMLSVKFRTWVESKPDKSRLYIDNTARIATVYSEVLFWIAPLVSRIFYKPGIIGVGLTLNFRLFIPT